MGRDLLYDHDKERIARYQSDIDRLLFGEEQIIKRLGDAKLDDLSMLLIKIRANESRAEMLLDRIRSDAAGLSGEYLSATGIYLDTVVQIIARLKELERMVEDAVRDRGTAVSCGEAAAKIEKLRAFAEGLNSE